MEFVVNKPVAFWPVKAAMAVAPAMAAERMWKRNKAARSR